MRKPKPFPKMLYRDEATLIVASARELAAARRDGWRTRDEVVAGRTEHDAG
jgi:hypothetical protein